MTSTADRISDLASQAGLSTTATAQTALPTVLRDLRRAILSALLDAGAAPALPWIADRARQFGADPDAALARLASDDLVHTADGAVSVAYPFSGSRPRTRCGPTAARRSGPCAPSTRSASR